MQITTGVQANEVQLGARHILFVEGSRDDAFDPKVLRELLKCNGIFIEVHGIGPCENIHNAAKAFCTQHPNYYFLIDRDERNDEFVEKSWANFPDPTTHNLLVWRKRELENYFIAPVYLSKSEFLRKGVTESDLKNKIQDHCQKRLFLEAANLVLLELRAKIGKPSQEWFRDADKFPDRAEALHHLLVSSELAQKKSEVDLLLSPDQKACLLDKYLCLMTGDKPTTPLEYGRGDWQNLISGKEIFRSLAGWAFQVKNTRGVVLQGKDQNYQVAKSLLCLPLEEQPDDFQQIVGLIQKRLH